MPVPTRAPIVLVLCVSVLAGCQVGGDAGASAGPDAVPKTQGELRTLATAIESFSIDDPNGEYPKVAGIEDLAAALEPTYLRDVPRNDAWGRPYDYTSTGRTYTLISLGADGEVATGDDLKIKTGNPNF